jgi:hypothetical protein
LNSLHILRPRIVPLQATPRRTLALPAAAFPCSLPPPLLSAPATVAAGPGAKWCSGVVVAAIRGGGRGCGVGTYGVRGGDPRMFGGGCSLQGLSGDGWWWWWLRVYFLPRPVVGSSADGARSGSDLARRGWCGTCVQNRVVWQTRSKIWVAWVLEATSTDSSFVVVGHWMAARGPARPFRSLKVAVLGFLLCVYGDLPEAFPS